MRIFKTAAGIRKFSVSLKKCGSIGFVPTMGCLHDGHLSLMRASARKCDYTVASIFVNPLQFGRNEDLDRYPRPLAADLEKCRREKIDAVFLPDAGEFYPADFSTMISESFVSSGFCGKFRPGHFNGVLTVVSKLMNCVQPDIMFMGRKDYQQCMVLKRLVRDLNFPVRVEICPTVREKNGLAMSSRNQYLTPDEKSNASGIYRALKRIREVFSENKLTACRKIFLEELNKIPGFSVQYADFADAETLAPAERDTIKIVALAAGFMGKTRLIDNMIIA